MNKMVINIAKDYTDTPGARFISDGEFSGEDFYNKFLKDKFLEAKKMGQKLEIILDDVWGFPPSFVSGSFGKLSHDYGAESVLRVIEFISKSNPLLVNKFVYMIKNPESREVAH